MLELVLVFGLPAAASAGCSALLVLPVFPAFSLFSEVLFSEDAGGSELTGGSLDAGVLLSLVDAVVLSVVVVVVSVDVCVVVELVVVSVVEDD